MSEAKKGQNNPKYGTGVAVLEKSKIVITLIASYGSFCRASKSISADKRTLKNYLNSGKLFRGKHQLLYSS